MKTRSDCISHSRAGAAAIPALLALCLVMPAADVRAACARACVITTVESYVSAAMAGEPGRARLAEDVRSTENGQVTEVGAGVWRTLTGQQQYRQVIVDSNLDSAVFFGAFRESDQPVLLAIRFALENSQIKELEHLVSRPDWRNRLILRHRLTEPDPVYEQVLPTSERASREELIAAAHAYFDGIAESSDERVSMHPECRRRENGVVLLQNPEPESQPCPTGFHRFNYITAVRDRRVAAVDEARGLVLIWAFFDVPGNIEVAPGRLGPSDASGDDESRVDTRKIPRSLYIAELFRVVDGGIRDIEAIMFNQDLGAESGW